MELARLGGAVVCVCVCEYGHCACSGQRGSVHLGLDRQWGRWGHIGTATCSVWFPAASTRGARGILCGISSRGGVPLAPGSLPLPGLHRRGGVRGRGSGMLAAWLRAPSSWVHARDPQEEARIRRGHGGELATKVVSFAELLLSSVGQV